MASLTLIRNDANMHLAEAIVKDNPGSELKVVTHDVLITSTILRINRRTIEQALRRRIDNKTWIFLLRHKEGMVKEITDEHMLIVDEGASGNSEEVLLKIPGDVWMNLEKSCREHIKAPEAMVLDILKEYFANHR